MEQKLESGAFVSAAPQSAAVPAAGGTQAPAAQAPEKTQLPKAIPEDIKQVMNNWRSVISEMGGDHQTVFESGSADAWTGGRTAPGV